MSGKILLTGFCLLISSMVYGKNAYNGHLPTREELLDKVFLVTVGDNLKYGKCLELGKLTTRHNPVMSNYEFSNIYDGIESIEPYVCVKERGRLYFSPGRATELYPNFEIGIIMPLRNVEDKLISVAWQEFITFDEIELGEGDMLVVKEGIEIPQIIRDRGIEVYYYKPGERYAGHEVVKDVIREKEGWVVDVDFNEKDSTNFYYIEGASIDGIYVDYREFLQPLEEKNVGIGIKHISISGEEHRVSWLGEKYSGRRNFGFEFYALKYHVDQYYKWHKDMPARSHEVFDEYIKGLFVSWDVLNYEKKPVDFLKIEQERGFKEAISLASVSLGDVLNKELVNYAGLSLDEVFDRLAKKGVYNFENIESSLKGFRNSFILELFVLKDEEIPGFIKGYKDYLKRYSIKPPYAFDKIEAQMLKIADKHKKTLAKVEKDFKSRRGYEIFEERVLYGNTGFVKDFMLETFEMDARLSPIQTFIKENKSTLTRKVEPESPDDWFMVESLTKLHTGYHTQMGNLSANVTRKLL